MAKLPSEPTTDHYTAVIEVHKVIGAYQPRNERDYPTGVEVGRQTTEVARIVVRSSDLDALKEKIAAHTELIEED